jgi:hypothetical protein
MNENSFKYFSFSPTLIVCVLFSKYWLKLSHKAIDIFTIAFFIISFITLTYYLLKYKNDSHPLFEVVYSYYLIYSLILLTYIWLVY